MYIPSNFSLTEIIKYAEMPDNIRHSISTVLDSIKEMQDDLHTANKRIELLQENIYFRDAFIEDVLRLTKTTTKHKDLVARINICFEESNIEL
jgi:predicted DNA-binding protein YlxM (UPF0122 family)